MHHHGRGVPADELEAVEWYRVAARQGHARSAFALAIIYDHGEGVVYEDDTEAVKWYELAAEAGHGRAQLFLAEMYRRGKGVPEDYVKAYSLFSRAAAQGIGLASKIKARMRWVMTSAQLAEAQSLCRA
jgi:TPR repeat protein